MNPAKAGRGNRTSKKSAQQAAIDLVHMVSNASSKDSAIQSRAFDAGTAVLGAWSSNIVASNDKPIVVLDRSLNTLAQINSAGKQSMLAAVSATITQDGKVTLREAELLRAVCAALSCPLPPLVTDISAISGN